MQSTFPGADIGRSSPLRAMPYRVMVAHFPARKNETFGRRCQRSLFFSDTGDWKEIRAEQQGRMYG